MFGNKKEQTGGNADRAILLECMEKAIEGDWTPVDVSRFQDAELAKKYNQMLSTRLQSDNVMAMSLNKVMTYVGDNVCVKNMIEQLKSQTSAIGDMNSSSQELGSSIESINTATAKIQERVHAIMGDTNACVDDMNSSIRTVDVSAERVLQINTQVADFQEKAAKINEIIDIVKKVANKSSMLALNATIEAARVGEAGKGFAVVANQINELAASTKKSAEDAMLYVSELLDGISVLAESIDTTATQLTAGNDNLHHSVEGMNRMNDNLKLISTGIDSICVEVENQSALTQSFVTSVETIATSYDALSQECNETGAQMVRISRRVDKLRTGLAVKRSKLTTLDWINVYEADHLVFTWRVYNHIADFEQLKITQLNNPRGCKFGKWYTAQNNPAITGSAAFKQAVKCHEELHKHAANAWNAKEENDREGALGHFQRALEAYDGFSSALRDLRKVIISTGDREETQVDIK